MNYSEWIEQSLAARGIKTNGEIVEVHRRPWSTVSRVPTNAGDFYFKALGPAFAFEPALTAALYQWRPDCITPVLNIETEQRWMLTAGGGRTLRQAFSAGLDVSAWKAILAHYAGLQIALAARVPDMLVMGVRDRSLQMLPNLYEALVRDTAWLLIGEEGGLTLIQHERLLAAIPQVAAMCKELASYHAADSLHHNDLHDANIFYNDQTPLFFDWGDSSVAYPFFSLRTVFVSIENSFGLAEDAPLFDDLARAYLRPWLKLETEENLWAAYRLARRLWSLSSAVKYKTQMQLIEGMREDYATAVPGLLLEFLTANPQLE